MTKSILKQPSGVQPHLTSQGARHRETALFHANLIQQQKDVELQILFATETLIDFPPSPDSDPAHPSQENIATAKTLLQSFQPSDFDALIEERNIDNKCGYVLCPKPNQKQDTNARCRILQVKGEGKKTLKFVDRRELERWCSDECGKRALFVRVQLSEDPAWTRPVGRDGDLRFLEDEGTSANNVDDALTAQLQNLDITLPVDGMTDALSQLAFERGDRDTHSKRKVKFDVNVCENTVLQDPMAPQPAEPQDSVDGYIPRFSNDKTIGRTRTKGM